MLTKTNPFLSKLPTGLTFNKQLVFSPCFWTSFHQIPDPRIRSLVSKHPRWREQQASSAASDTGGLGPMSSPKKEESLPFFWVEFFLSNWNMKTCSAVGFFWMHDLGEMSRWFVFVVSCNSNSLWCFYQILRIFIQSEFGSRGNTSKKTIQHFWWNSGYSSRFRGIFKRPIPWRPKGPGAVTPQVLQVWATLRLRAVRR